MDIAEEQVNAGLQSGCAQAFCAAIGSFITRAATHAGSFGHVEWNNIMKLSARTEKKGSAKKEIRIGRKVQVVAIVPKLRTA